jgi:hypothetical protein
VVSEFLPHAEELASADAGTHTEGLLAKLRVHLLEDRFVDLRQAGGNTELIRLEDVGGAVVGKLEFEGAEAKAAIQVWPRRRSQALEPNIVGSVDSVSGFDDR